MGQERSSNLFILSIEYNIVKDINYNDIIDEFAEIKVRSAIKIIIFLFICDFYYYFSPKN